MRTRSRGLGLKSMAAALVVIGFVLGSPALASATPPPTKLLLIYQGTPMARVLFNDSVPVGFSTTAADAMRVAKSAPVIQSVHRQMHPLRVTPFVWRSVSPYWYVVFTYHGQIVADAAISPAGKLIGAWTGPEARAPYTHGHYPTILDTWLILLPFSVLFLVPFFDPRRLRRLLHLDALVMVAFVLPYLLLAHEYTEPAVWLVYPPLLYLLFRLLWLGRRERTMPGRLAPLLGMRTLAVGLPLLLIARTLLSIFGHQEMDVGYESVIGAYHILHHLPLYWADANHGDTYGPITYLAYVPFELIWPWTNSLSNLHAADAAAIFFDLGTVVALLFLGRRLRPGREGTRLGLIFGWGWAACPFTTFAVIVHTNDALIALLSVLALLALASPALSGALLGLATAAKFSPAALLPVLAGPRQRGVKGALIFTAVFTAVVAASIFSWLPAGGLAYFWKRTIGYQMSRPDVLSPWALHPGLHPVQTVVEVLAVVLMVAVAFGRRERSFTQVAALAGAVTIAIQLPAVHWFYYYILWFLPFMLVAMLVPERVGRRRTPEEHSDDAPMSITDQRSEAQPALVGA